MRIAHVSDCYLPMLGGIEMQVHDLATRQRAAGHVAEVLTTTPATTAKSRMQQPDPDWVHRIGPELAHPAARALNGALRARALVTPDKYDAVHVHASVLSPFATAAASAAARAGLATVITVHSLWSGLGPLPRIADLSMGLRTWPVVWSTVSEAAATPLRRMLGGAGTVAVLPNGIDADMWRVDPAPRDARTVTVVSVMRLASRKRPIPLLRMMRSVRALVPPDIRLQLVLIGDGPLRPAMLRYLNRHDMAHWVTLAGRLERRQIREIFASSDLYVAPARLESFGIAALEARSAGLPVVASSRGGVDEFITNGREGLLVRDDAEMVKALVALIVTPSMRGAITLHNRQVAPAVSWPMVLDRALQLYERAASLCGAVSPPQLFPEAARSNATGASA